MAEAKKTTPKKTQATKPASQSKQTNKKLSEIQEVFETVRSSFVDTMKKLASYQKDFEKIIAEYNEKGAKYQQDLTKVLEQWYSTLQKVQEDMTSLAKDTFESYMPSNYNLPFAVEFEKIASQMQDMFKKFFSAFPVFKK
jgi:predicted DNA-binding protein YlxM (UPF0122 family)